MRFYFDTSVIAALFDDDMPHRVVITRQMLNLLIEGEHIGLISNVLIGEVEKAPSDLRYKLFTEINKIPFEIVEEDEESAYIVEEYEKEDFIRKKAIMDLRHLALATANGVDALLSWNFRDMVNIVTRRAVHSVNLRLGYPLIEIVSPEEVIEYD